MRKELDFSALVDAYGGLLSPDDLHLFYYDICFDKQTGRSLSFKWDEEIETFLKEHDTVIDSVETIEQSMNFEDNRIYFTFAKADSDDKATALFRHLRNAFSHYSIGYNGKFFCMEDFEYKNGKRGRQTMIGKIEENIFKGLINLFFKQKSIIMEEELKITNQEV